MKILNWILYIGYKIIEVIGSIVLAAIMLIVTAGIVSRYCFNSPFSWTEELTTFLMVYLCYTSAALTTVQKKHIVADFFISKAPAKFQKAVSIFSRMLMVIFFVVVCYSVARLVPSLTWTSAVLAIPRKYYYLPVFAMSIYMIYAVVVDVLNDFFPGYDIMAQKNKQHDEAEKAAELKEAEEMQEKMDEFLHDSGIDINPGANQEGS